MDAITLLKDDHQQVKRLFRDYQKLGDRATASKRKIVTQLIEELSRHAAIEEQLFYPFARQVVPDATDDVLEGLEEHHIVKWTLSELVGMDPEDERFDAKVRVLTESVLHHAEEEETELFPQIRDAVGRKDLQELGEAMEALKKAAPTRPHPRSPDEPPANWVSGPAAAAIDRARDIGLRAVSELTSAVRRRR